MSGKALTADTKKKIRVATLLGVSMIFVSIAAAIAVIVFSYMGNKISKKPFTAWAVGRWITGSV